MKKQKPTFTCPYRNDRGCKHVDTSGMSVTTACEDCDWYSKDNIRLSDGCLELTTGMALGIIIIILIILL